MVYLFFMEYPKALKKIIGLLKKFPGVGGKSAERIAFHILEWPKEQLSELASSLTSIQQEVLFCSECGAIQEEQECAICSSKERNKKTLCIVASARDLYAIEQTRQYWGIYHVLGALLSPLEGKEIPITKIESLKSRIEKYGIEEIILAFDSTVEGDATSLFLKKILSPFPVKVYRLAFGLPVGSSLDYTDAHTLTRALAGKQTF